MDQHGIGIAFGGWAPDWPDGYGFFYYISDGAAISPAGNTNISQLNDPVINNYLTQMAATNNATTRNSFTSKIDLQIMKDAAILPEVYAKSLLYRSPSLTNVMVQPVYGMYNYATLGLKS
jgi:peptide/nickel transport system substrate-binding protein